MNSGSPCTLSAPPERPPGGGPPQRLAARTTEAADPRTKFISDPPAGGTRPRLATSDLPTHKGSGSRGSYDPPGQFGAALAAADIQRAQRPPCLAHHRRRKQRSNLILRNHLQCLSLQLGREVDHVVDRKAVAPIRRRFGRNRLRGRIPFAWHVALVEQASLRSARWAAP